MNGTTDFEQFVMQGTPPAAQFRPTASYDRDGDCIEFFMSGESFYGKRLDSLVTVYYGQKSGDIVGTMIKGVSRIWKVIRERAPGFMIEVKDNKIALKHVFSACLWSEGRAPGSPEVKTYKILREAAAKDDVEVDAEEFASA